jgi:formate hydrogenlyase subunit 4
MTPVTLALATIRESYEVLGLIGIIATLAGVWMQSKRSGLDSDAEEAVKDGMMTEMAARRRISIITWGTRLLTATGVVCLSFAGWRLFR